MKRALLLTLLLLIALTLAAQVRGPVSGFVYDGYERALRPIIGFPGAAYLGLAVTGAVDAASASPDGRLAVISEGSDLYLIRDLD
ncbi:MAG: hypothetical protein GY953_12975, partial [bacterium]|nr:hypothetical protein [bacterium]